MPLKHLTVVFKRPPAVIVKCPDRETAVRHVGDAGWQICVCLLEAFECIKVPSEDAHTLISAYVILKLEDSSTELESTSLWAELHSVRLHHCWDCTLWKLNIYSPSASFPSCKYLCIYIYYCFGGKGRAKDSSVSNSRVIKNGGWEKYHLILNSGVEKGLLSHRRGKNSWLDKL